MVEYEERYGVVAELRRGGERHESLRYGARIELGLRPFLTEGGFTAFTTNFEDLGGLRQLPGGPRHTVLSTALGREALVDFADMAGVELVLIDEATETRSFARQLRCDNTYYRLTQHS